MPVFTGMTGLTLLPLHLEKMARAAHAGVVGTDELLDAHLEHVF